MQKDHDYYIGLLSAYIDDRLAPAQVEELFAFIQLEPMAYRSMLDEPAIQQQLAEKSNDQQIPVPDATSERIWQRLHTTTGTGTRRIYRMISYAAALLVLVSGIYLLTRQAPKSKDTPATAVVNIPPGANKATLTLAGGQIILLDSSANGQLAIQGNTTITKNEGQITYGPRNESTATVVVNTLTTPRGGQYQLTLPDGTKVWVNAASSITYPTAFQNKERKVTIRGEAFLEVAQNKNQPFIVEIPGGPQIQVLGTQFNINAYTDEPSIRTTLINGSVKVQYNNQSLILKPAQQAQLGKADAQTRPEKTTSSRARLLLDKSPNIDEVLAWKNGAFLFSRAPLDVVMRQLSRWYDIDIVYAKEIPPIYFEGEIKRDLNLSEVLNILRKMEVHCKMDGRKLIVLP